jgi:hypothetical protein
LGEHRPYKPRVTGSSPVPPTRAFSKLKHSPKGGVAQLWLERPGISCREDREFDQAEVVLSKKLKTVLLGA